MTMTKNQSHHHLEFQKCREALPILSENAGSFAPRRAFFRLKTVSFRHEFHMKNAKQKESLQPKEPFKSNKYTDIQMSNRHGVKESFRSLDHSGPIWDGRAGMACSQNRRNLLLQMILKSGTMIAE